MNDWWTPKDSDEYNKRAELLIEQYSNYTVHGKNVNGKLCAGENIADLGGVKLAHIGFQRFYEKHKDQMAEVEGFTPEQRFFLVWATIWRNNIRKEMALQRLIMDRKLTFTNFLMSHASRE